MQIRSYRLSVHLLCCTANLGSDTSYSVLKVCIVITHLTFNTGTKSDNMVYSVPYRVHLSECR